MTFVKWLVALALSFLLFQGKQAPLQGFEPTVRQQLSFFEKPVDKSQEIYHAQPETRIIVSKLNEPAPSAFSFYSAIDTRAFKQLFVFLQQVPPACFPRLDILSSKHHPPTTLA